MATIRFSTLKRTLSSSFKLANQIDVRPSYACINGNRHAREPTYSKTYAAPKCFNTRGIHSASGTSHVTSYLSGRFDTKSLRGSKSILVASPILNNRWYSSFDSSKGDTPKGSGVSTGASGSDVDTGGVSGNEWVGNFKEAWQTAVDAVTYTGEKAKEASSEMTPYVEQVLDAHPYLRDVIVPVGGTLTGTLMAWVVLPRLLRRFHKYSMQGPAALLPGSSIWGPVPYEKSIWGAMEDPVRYLITFMAFSQIAVMVAPSTIASQYLLQTWRGAATLSFVWFLQRWKTNVISRALVVKSLEKADRDRLLTLDRISSVGLFTLGLMTLAEVCGVAVQSILTVGGIGGVATAFAARDILGNVLSGLSVQLSQPFSVGDTIKAGSVEGQVVEMGLTTTSLLTAEKFPVIVPNSLFSSQVIVNKSRAQWRAVVTTVPFQIEDFDKIVQITDDVKSMLKSNPNAFLEKEAPYCYLSKIEKTYAELTLGCNLRYASKDQLFSAQQDILLQAARIVKQHGGTLADPWSQ
ncbi:mechanosensitive ion channel protein 1, mitochondrial-like isoform X1 [Lycium ferocissimum]|uniref:mechanosensitive ion channel protein 1, mitochondrial-like isoform X1 n=1 Tax=Lycium ferocissimum TaxID=112874 RepID=UPI00281637F7|nr:mechanosensitive ion channel protein 1, mitochondrial-like isoform X1 [Lycium ferocissimum]XP_059301602.1 mechanosensitive ion channel protein 1, mitochondrial-like isoform X1 [Lycium ferocissimum]